MEGGDARSRDAKSHGLVYFAILLFQSHIFLRLAAFVRLHSETVDETVH